MQTFYRRPLPESLIAFSSEEGRALFREALALGGMESFFALSEQFHTQAEPAYCGLGTLVVVLNALSIDPGRLWKGPWRWFSEEMLECCHPLEAVQKEGITFGQFACLARCNGAKVEAKRAQSASLEELRRDLQRACSTAHAPYLVASYSRKALGQTGDGHYSPIAGYHPQRDLALILDVARFKYPPHWVPVPKLWESLLPIDPATGQGRGYFLLERSGAPCTLCFRIHGEGFSWREVMHQITAVAPTALANEAPQNETEVIQAFLRQMTPALSSLVSALPPQEMPKEHREVCESLYAQLRETPLFLVARQALQPSLSSGLTAEIATALLFLTGDYLFSRLSSPLQEKMKALSRVETLPSPLQEEMKQLQGQLALLEDFCCTAG